LALVFYESRLITFHNDQRRGCVEYVIVLVYTLRLKSTTWDSSLSLAGLALIVSHGYCCCSHLSCVYVVE